MEPTLLLTHSEILEQKLDPFTFETGKALFHEHGFLKIGNLFPREWIQSLADSFLKDLSYDPEKMTLSQGAKIHRGRFIVSIPFVPPFSQPNLYANPLLLAFLRAILGPDCILGGLGAVVSLPGATEQHVHSDYEPLFKDQPFLAAVHAPYAIAVGVPLVDIDLLNGPTKIWSATHRAVEIDKAKLDEFYERHLLYGPMGSCYFWDYRTFHAGGSNHSESLRSLLYLSYTRPWFRDLKNPDRVVLDDQEIPKEHAILFPRKKHLTSRDESDFQSKVQELFQEDKK